MKRKREGVRVDAGRVYVSTMHAQMFSWLHCRRRDVRTGRSPACKWGSVELHSPLERRPSDPKEDVRPVERQQRDGQAEGRRRAAHAGGHQLVRLEVQLPRALGLRRPGSSAVDDQGRSGLLEAACGWGVARCVCEAVGSPVAGPKLDRQRTPLENARSKADMLAHKNGASPNSDSCAPLLRAKFRLVLPPTGHRQPHCSMSLGKPTALQPGHTPSSRLPRSVNDTTAADLQ